MVGVVLMCWCGIHELGGEKGRTEYRNLRLSHLELRLLRLSSISSITMSDAQNILPQFDAATQVGDLVDVADRDCRLSSVNLWSRSWC